MSCYGAERGKLTTDGIAAIVAMTANKERTIYDVIGLDDAPLSIPEISPQVVYKCEEEVPFDNLDAEIIDSFSSKK